MTHFMRYTLLGTIVAGGALAVIAQDDIDALLGGLIMEPPAAEEELGEPVPADDSALADILAAEPEAAADDLLADMAAEEVPAEQAAPETVADAEASVDEALDALTAVDTAAAEAAAEAEALAAAEAEAAAAAEAEALAAAEAEAAAAAEAEAAAAAEAEALAAAEAEAAEEDVAEAEAAEEAVVEAEPEVPAEEPAVEPEAVAEAAPAAEPAEPVDALLPGEVETVVTEEDRAFSELATLERIRQQGFDAYAQSCLDEAIAALNAQPQPPVGQAFDYYKGVIRKFEDAKTYFVERPDNVENRKLCDQGIRECVYRQANALFQLKQYPEALDLAQRAQKNGHKFGNELVARITAAMNVPKQYIPEAQYPVHADPDYRQARLERIDRFQRATVYFHLGNYDKALEQVDLILREDPDNESAISLRARIGERQHKRAEQLRASMHDTMIAQVSANWTPLGYLAADSDEISAPKVTSSGNEEVTEDKEAKAAAQRVYEKLDYIILPEFSVGAPNTLDDVVKFFAELSRTYDKPELPPEERGVSFVLNWGKPQAAAPVSDDPFASDSGSSGSGLPPIRSISLNYVTLREALNTVCTVTGAKYVIEGKTVMIVPTDYVDGKLEERWYNVLPEFADKMSGMSSDMGSSGGDSGGWGDDTSFSSGGGDTDSWKSVFSQFGVSFEGKASIAYFPQIGKIRVENTLENLARFESVLEKLNVTPFQIEVEARFVEVSQTDLNSLGFEWRLNQNITGTIGSGIDWASSAITGNSTGGDFAGGQDANGGYIFRRASRSTGTDNIGMHAGTINNGMRFLGDSSLAANRVNLGGATIAPDDTFATFSAVFGKLDMTMILHMLAQRSDTDMLSSPKVLVKSGQEAIFKVVTEWIYPTEFSVRELDMNNNSNNDSGGGTSIILPFMVEPQSFEKRDVGITMQVAPGISQEGQMIELSIGQLEVVEYLGDFDYGMEYPYSEIQTTGLPGLGDLGTITTQSEVKFFHIPMPQPKFHIRTISTLLSIYNGATVVMGGLITENRESFEDKTPILGDLPFIGFLFRSEGEWSEKRNLLVFLTARLVDPAGRAIRTATDGTMGAAGDFAGGSSMSAAAE